MATRQVSQVIQHLRRAVLLRDGTAFTDGQLLECFIQQRDNAACAALVQRHGPMVWGVCRRILPNHQDAEDAFQATFLVLVRRAASVMPREMVANWLYGVAHQTALKARATAALRRGRERQVTTMPEPVAAGPDPWPDLQPLLDQELSRLPDKYRVPVVLCDLEGKTRKEAARQLDWPEGTVAGRLVRARVMLAKRLARHGVVLSGGALAAVVSQNAAAACVPAALASATIKTASLVAAGQALAPGAIPATVAALTDAMMKGMLLSKLKIATAVLLAVGLSALTCGIMVKGAGQTEVRVNQRESSQLANQQAPKQEEPLQGNRIPLTDYLQGKWTGEKNGIKVDLTLNAKQAVWTVEFVRSRKPKVPNQSPTVAVVKGADLKCVPDMKADRWNLYLPSYLGDNEEIKQIDAFNGRAAVGQFQRRAEGTLQLRMIPTGYENLALEDYDYPSVEGMVLRWVGDPPKDPAEGAAKGGNDADRSAYPRVSTDTKRATIEGQLDEASELVLRIGADKDKLAWTDSRPNSPGPFKAVVELSDRIKLNDGSFARGFIFTVESSQGRVKSQVNVPLPKTGPMPSGQLSFREASKIIRKDGVTTFADIMNEDGKSIPVSIFVRKK
jgi:RNA polymerase sigma factor (sigma-70 family)